MRLKPILAFLLLINILFTTQSFSADIPIIVISPGKTPQSLNTVGSSVTVIDGDAIAESSHSSLVNIIDDLTTSTNMFQVGGHGANTGIQLRGLEKRYSTVYIDGVKMLDPSSSDGSFYMENIMKNSIDRVEVLKGTQSSLYGSNAIGGTIHIFTKKGRQGNHSDFEFEAGSNNKKKFVYSFDGAGDKFQYYLGLNKFLTDGISAMNDNDEKDEYKNDGFVGNFGFKISDNFRIENSFRYTDAYYAYDEVVKGRSDSNDFSDNMEASLNLKLIHEKDKFKNTLIYNKMQSERYTTNYAFARTNYMGYRDAINYLGEYNFNLDKKIVFGIDSEFDAARYKTAVWPSNGEMQHHDESTISQYFDFQFRPLEKLYSTFGLRSDEHSTVGRKTSGRTTLAYLLDGNSKIRSSFGAGVRFPSLYAYKYGSSMMKANGSTLEALQSERGLSFDLGYDTYLDNADLGLGITFFRVEQKNSIVSNALTDWISANATGKNTSQGVELTGKWKPVNKKISLDFGYTFTNSYDANSCTAEQKASSVDNECHSKGSKLETAKVRVPRHALDSRINYKISPNLKTSLKGKYIGETRDFGNQNDSWNDQILQDYFVFSLEANYKLFNSYNIFGSINNILDDEYQQAHEYSSMGRNFNFGIKKAF